MPSCCLQIYQRLSHFKDDKDLNKITRIFQFYENNKSILDTLGHI